MCGNNNCCRSVQRCIYMLSSGAGKQQTLLLWPGQGFGFHIDRNHLPINVKHDLWFPLLAVESANMCGGDLLLWIYSLCWHLYADLAANMHWLDTAGGVMQWYQNILVHVFIMPTEWLYIKAGKGGANFIWSIYYRKFNPCQYVVNRTILVSKMWQNRRIKKYKYFRQRYLRW